MCYDKMALHMLANQGLNALPAGSYSGARIAFSEVKEQKPLHTYKSSTVRLLLLCGLTFCTTVAQHTDPAQQTVAVELTKFRQSALRSVPLGLRVVEVPIIPAEPLIQFRVFGLYKLTATCALHLTL